MSNNLRVGSNEALDNSETQTTKSSPLKKICPECLSQVRLSTSNNPNKKLHYTIRRAPVKISHLIPASHSQDLIINFDKKTDQIAF